METAVNLVQDGAPLLGERVLVLGQGVVGLLTASLLNEFPLERLVTADRNELRRKASMGMGVRESFDPEQRNADNKSNNSIIQSAHAQSFDLSYELSDQASAPIPSSAVLQSPASLPPGATAATEPAAASGPAAPAPPRPSVDAPVSRITISRGASTAIVNPLLTEAYAALQADNLEAAQRLYTQLTKNEPRSIDAWLGLAAVASQQGKTDEATRHYLQVLDRSAPRTRRSRD